MPVRLKPAASWSQVKHSTIEPLRSLRYVYAYLNSDSTALSSSFCLSMIRESLASCCFPSGYVYAYLNSDSTALSSSFCLSMIWKVKQAVVSPLDMSMLTLILILLL